MRYLGLLLLAIACFVASFMYGYGSGKEEIKKSPVEMKLKIIKKWMEARK